MVYNGMPMHVFEDFDDFLAQEAKEYSNFKGVNWFSRKNLSGCIVCEPSSFRLPENKANNFRTENQS
jgi:hypothetical protein